MHKFFVTAEAVSGGLITISGPDARHIRTVLRLGVGDGILITDGAGTEHVSRICRFAQGAVFARIEATAHPVREPKVPLQLIQALPKSDKMDFVVQKCTEIGVSRFVPVITDRTIPRPDASRAVDRVARWRRVAGEAAKQCGRGRIPDVEPITDLANAARSCTQAGGLLLLPWELERTRTLRHALDTLDPESRPSVSFAVGPEGGFSHSEVEAACDLGAVTVTLGHRILRTETAGIVMASIILYHMGEIGC
ncbi:MAG: 16S rRNA (uracil(1498)-N(3))-methyltransferase [Firmicutes bacterium]|jgi:16S rRNA (uracil1498-N3)-methyltransferase|nr:16S rRNA (uracil(1498)-N(3))-methyltransferase [Bacillota bacterium]